jgi:hypothetical protein
VWHKIKIPFRAILWVLFLTSVICFIVKELRGTRICNYVKCPASVRPFWISREPGAWPWYNLAASQRRPYCASVNSHSPVGLVSRQWDAVDWSCVLCDRGIQNDRASRSASSRQCACPFYSSRTGLFWQSITSPRPVSLPPPPPPSLDLALCDFWLFPKLKSLLKGRWFVNAAVTHYTSSVNGVSLPTD